MPFFPSQNQATDASVATDTWRGGLHMLPGMSPPSEQTDPSTALGATVRASELYPLHKVFSNPVSQVADSSYNPITDPANKGYEEVVAPAINKEQADRLRQDSIRRQLDQQALGQLNTIQSLLSSGANFIINPSSAIFLFAPGLLTGRILETAAKSATVFGGAEAAHQGIYAAQGRAESVSNAVDSILSSALIGMAIPPALRGVIKSPGLAESLAGKAVEGFDSVLTRAKAIKEAESAFKSDRKTKQDAPPETVPGPASATGADVAEGGQWNPEAPARSFTPVHGEHLAKAVAKMTPIDALFSANDLVRSFMDRLGRHSLSGYKILADGSHVPASRMVPVESIVTRRVEQVRRAAVEDRKLYMSYRKQGGDIPETQFNELVSKVLAGVRTTGEVPAEVVQIAERYRKQLYDTVSQDAVDAGVYTANDPMFKKAYSQYREEVSAAGKVPQTELDFYKAVQGSYEKGTEFAGSKAGSKYVAALQKSGSGPQLIHMPGDPSFVNKSYNKNSIINGERDSQGRTMKQALADEFRKFAKSDLAKANESLAKVEAELGAAQEKIAKSKKPKTPVHADLIAKREKALAKAQQLEAALEDAAGYAQEYRDNILNSRFGQVSDRVTLRGSSLHMRTDRISMKVLEPWLNWDIRHLSNRYIMDVAPAIELTRAFGTDNIEVALKPVRQRGSDMVEAETDPAKSRRLFNSLKRNYADIEHTWQRVRGQVGFSVEPHDGFTRIGHLLRSLSLTTKLGFLPFSAMNDISRVGMVAGQLPAAKMAVRMIADAELSKMSNEMLGRLVGLSEIAMTRVMNQAELALLGGTQTMFEKATSGAVKGFIKATGMAHMNEWTKTWAGTLYRDEVVRVLKEGKFDHTFLRDYGFNGDNARRLAKELKSENSGLIDHNGVYLVDTAKWEDQELATWFDSATKDFMDEAIITPGALDRPKWMDNTELGKTLGVFRSFSFATNNKVILSGMTGHQAAFASGLASMTFIGLLSWQAKQIMRGHSDRVGKLSNPAYLAQVLVQSSGLGTLPEVISFLFGEMATRGAFMKGVRLGKEVAGAAIGGTLVDAGNAVFSPGINTATKVLPFYNLWQSQLLRTMLFGGSK